ncbi:hypothetical protein, partial [Desulfuromonas acetoxidans]|uniref:hypothetical protein n=1 Tax=Desulfuromonas acetoxidans TaxID=891 RepID=UPI001A7E5B3B
MNSNESLLCCQALFLSIFSSAPTHHLRAVFSVTEAELYTNRGVPVNSERGKKDTPFHFIFQGKKPPHEKAYRNFKPLQ